MMQNLQLHKFNPMILEKRRMDGNAPVIVMIGKRGSGKSTIIQDIMFFMKKVPATIAFSGTEDGNGFYSKHIHQAFIYNKYDQGALDSIVARQKKYVHDLKNKGIDPKTCPEIGIFIIMDDLAYDDKMMKNEAMKEIFFNGRHYHITVVISFQFMMMLKPAYRANIDYVFICRDNKNDNIKRYYDYFFGIFDSFEDFKKVFYSCTNDFGCLVLDNTCRTNKIEDQVFWYRAKPDRKFKIGSDAMWEQWNKHLRSNAENEHETSERVSLSKSKIREIKKMGPKKIEYNNNNDDDYEEDLDELILNH